MPRDAEEWQQLKRQGGQRSEQKLSRRHHEPNPNREGRKETERRRQESDQRSHQETLGTQAGRSFEGGNKENNYQEPAEEDSEASREICGIRCLMPR